MLILFCFSDTIYVYLFCDVLPVPCRWRCPSFQRCWGDRRRSHVLSPPGTAPSITFSRGVLQHSAPPPLLLRGPVTAMSSCTSTVTLCPAAQWSHCPSSSRRSYASSPTVQSRQMTFSRVSHSLFQTLSLPSVSHSASLCLTFHLIPLCFRNSLVARICMYLHFNCFPHIHLFWKELYWHCTSAVKSVWASPTSACFVMCTCSALGTPCARCYHSYTCGYYHALSCGGWWLVSWGLGYQEGDAGGGGVVLGFRCGRRGSPSWFWLVG